MIKDNLLDINDLRELGREYAKTTGSSHYKSNIDPVEYSIGTSQFEGFAITNVIKYVSRFGRTRNLEDLKKASDYVHIMIGKEIVETNTAEQLPTQATSLSEMCESILKSIRNKEGDN